MTAYGMPQAVIGKLLGFAPKTLRKWFRNELDFGGAQANAEMAGYLFKNGKEGNVVAQIFYLKTRAGWKEPVRVEHSGSVDHLPTKELWLEMAGGDFTSYLLFTIPADLTGGPTMTFPAAFDTDRLPITMQLSMDRIFQRSCSVRPPHFQRMTDWYLTPVFESLQWRSMGPCLLPSKIQ
jgi:hypothetical protein